MPKAMISDRARLEALLNESPVGCLALVGADGAPYAVPLNFVCLDGRIYFHCAFTGRKIECLRANPRVCFTAWVVDRLSAGPQACDSTVDYRSVIAWGEARSVSDVDERRRILTALGEKYAGAPVEPPSLARCAETEVIGIAVSEMTGKRSY